MNEYFGKIIFSMECEGEPRRDYQHHSLNNGITIWEFYDACKNFALSCGYSPEQVEAAFDHDYDY